MYKGWISDFCKMKIVHNIMSCKQSAVNLANTSHIRHNHSIFLHIFNLWKIVLTDILNISAIFSKLKLNKWISSAVIFGSLRSVKRGLCGKNYEFWCDFLLLKYSLSIYEICQNFEKNWHKITIFWQNINATIRSVGYMCKV